MKKFWPLLLLLSSCIEYRFPIPDQPDKYIGWGNTPPKLDPKIGPKAKIYFTDEGKFRPYLGAHIIHQEELLLGLGAVYYVSKQLSFEIGFRDSVYQTDRFSERLEKGTTTLDSWDEHNPMIFIGGVKLW